MLSTIRPTAAAIGVNCSTALRGMFIFPGRFSFIYSPLIVARFYLKGPCCFLSINSRFITAAMSCRSLFTTLYKTNSTPIYRSTNTRILPISIYFFYVVQSTHRYLSELQTGIYQRRSGAHVGMGIGEGDKGGRLNVGHCACSSAAGGSSCCLAGKNPMALRPIR